MKSDPIVILHVSIITPIDLGKILRELIALDNRIINSKSKYKHYYEGSISESFDALVKSIGVNLDVTDQRQQLIKQLNFVRKTAPIVQMTFANEPSRPALSMLIKWFRENGHPNTLISVGVQPAIAGGCLVRTQTKNFDFSLAKKLNNSPIKVEYINSTEK